MKLRLNSPSTIALIILVLAIVLGAGTIAYAAYGKHVEGPFMKTVAGWMPAAKVGSTSISYGEYLDHTEAASRFIAAQAPIAGTSAVMSDDDRKAALDRAVRMAAVQEMAGERQVVVTPVDIGRAYDQVILQTGTSTTPDEFRQYLADVYGWTEDDFKHFILGPALLEDEVKNAYVRDGKTEDDFNKDLDTAMSEPHTHRYIKF